MNQIIKFLAFIAALTLVAQISSFGLNLGNGYYGILIVIFAILLIIGKSNRFNTLMIWLTFAGLISIAFNEIPSFFKPYERFAAFLIVMGLVGPMIRNSALQKFRIVLFKMIKVLIVTMVIISFLGIAAGLPTMVGRGGFAGLFNHSMTLGPMAAIALLICISWGNTSNNKKKRYFFLALAAISFITCLAAGSRAALLAGVAGGLFFYYKVNQGNLSRYVRVIMFTIAIGILSFPLWESYTERIMGKMAFAEDQGDLLVTREALWTIRVLEFEKSPIYGIGFAAVDTSLTDKYDEIEGNIEPGSSWLAVLSMVGLLGFIPLILLLLGYLKFLYQDKIMKQHSALLGALLILCIVHMMAEGYVFSAGSGMFFIFWFIMGLIEQTKKFKLNMKNSVI
ncbi:MAG: O-antigen ligase family protein [Lutibacter sp.]